MTLRRFNNILSGIVILLGIYITLSPFLPEIMYWFKDKSPEVSAPYAGALAESVGSESDSERPKDNRLVIPSIQINEPIMEGSNIWVIHDGGVWHRPKSSAPDQEGNSVLVGHRFYGNNISTFYHLDKVLVGQRLAVYWEGEEILYEVIETKVVSANATEIEAPTTEKLLTIYTCTPIWTAKNRLVVVAKPVASEQKSDNQQTEKIEEREAREDEIL